MTQTRQKAKGRRDNKPFVKFNRDFLESDEFTQLSPFGVKLLCDLAAQFRGNNNGDLCCAWTLMEKRGWRSRGTLNKAQLELESTGWIERTRQGGRHKANLFALSWFPIDECKGKLDVKSTIVASNAWKNSVTLDTCQCDTPTVSKLNNQGDQS